MSGTCVRCGRVGEVEYGSDGLSYCSGCAFYGLNKQCWKCRMYLPSNELQQYRGQWVCPYCVQDMRETDRKASEYHPEKPHVDVLSYTETCERCGRDLKGHVYIWNGKKLCKKCVSDEQEKWGLIGGGPMGAPQRISIEPSRKVKERSIIDAMINEVLGMLGMKRNTKIEIIEYKTKMPIQNAKPMAESNISGKVEKKPQAEGIMGVETPQPLPERHETEAERIDEELTEVPKKAVKPAQKEAERIEREIPEPPKKTAKPAQKKRRTPKPQASKAPPESKAP